MINFPRALVAIFFAAVLAACGGDDGLSSLHRAAKDGDTAEVKRLIDNGAAIDAKTKDGWTPLHYAAFLEGDDTVAALIEAGADVNAKTNYGVTPLRIAINNLQLKSAAALVVAKVKRYPKVLGWE